MKKKVMQEESDVETINPKILICINL